MKNDLQSALKVIKNYLKTRPEVVAAYLFGSQLGKDTRGANDIDLGILLKLKTSSDAAFDLQIKLMSEVDALVPKTKVDVLILNILPTEMKFEIIQQGKIFYCTNDKERVHFETKTSAAYYDFRPILSRYDQMLRDSILKEAHL